MKRIFFPTMCASALVACNPAGNEQNHEKPNILLIYADDVGIGDLGCYGATLIKTPNIDAIAKNGIRFDNAYCTAAMSTPSRFSLLTGIYAFRLKGAGILSAEDPMLIKPGSFTLPEMLRGCGYRTGIVGKWHLGLGSTNKGVNWNEEIKPGPLEVGFDESFILPVTNDRVPTVFVEGHRVLNLNPEEDPLLVSYPVEAQHNFQESQFGVKRETGIEVLVGDLPTGLNHPELLKYGADIQHSGTIVNGVSRIGHMSGGKSAWWDDEKIAGIFVEKTRKFITGEKSKPFFLFLSMHENHVPRIPDPRFVGKSGVGIRGDCLLELDSVVGEIIEMLKTSGQYENTLVIFSSDNGPVLYDGYNDRALENHNGHDPSSGFRGGKYISFEGGTRMPTLLQWPGKVKKGQVSDALLSQVDLLASFASLVGSEIPEGINLDSRNMMAALLGKSKNGREYIVQQSSDGLGLREGKWKYIEASARSEWAYNRHNLVDTNSMHLGIINNTEYLFDIEADPEETTNLAEKYPKKLKELAEILEQVKNQF